MGDSKVSEMRDRVEYDSFIAFREAPQAGTTGPTRLWLLFGLFAGLGLLTKVTMLFFGFAIFAPLLVTPGDTCSRHGRGWAA
jgi:4-amino-4-deoxy-L-arabinose transferase-like glycosyltransferase